MILISAARLHEFSPGLSAIRPGLLLTILGILALATSHKGNRRLRHLKSRLGYLMVSFVILCTVGAPFALYKSHAVSYLLTDFWVQALAIVILASAVRDTHDLKRLLGVYAIGAVAYALLAQGTGTLQGGGDYYDANDSAMLIVSAIPLVFYFFGRARNIFAKLIFGLGIAICGSTVVLSGSRGGFLALVAVFSYSLFFLEGIKPLFRGAVVAGALLVVSVQANDEFWQDMGSITAEDDYNRTEYTGRVAIWKRGISYTLDHPVFGVGIANFSFAESRHPDAVANLERGRGVKFSAPHSIWIQTAAETGIPGFLIYVSMFWFSFRILWSAGRMAHKSVRASPELEPLTELGRPLLGVLLGIVVAGSFLSQAYASLVWFPFGFALALIKLIHIKEKELLGRAGSQNYALRYPVTSGVGWSLSPGGRPRL
jgi:O-antigen ligase